MASKAQLKRWGTQSLTCEREWVNGQPGVTVVLREEGQVKARRTLRLFDTIQERDTVYPHILEGLDEALFAVREMGADAEAGAEIFKFLAH